MVGGLVYILQSFKTGDYYIGSTNDLKRRLLEHVQGRSKYTSGILPVKLVFYQQYSTLLEARKIELKLKKFKNRNIIEKIISDGRITMGP